MQIKTWDEFYAKNKDSIKNVEEAYQNWVVLQNQMVKQFLNYEKKPTKIIKEKNSRNGN